MFQSPTNKVTATGTLEAAGADQTGAKIQTNINGKIYDFTGKIKVCLKLDSVLNFKHIHVILSEYPSLIIIASMILMVR